VVFSGFGDFLNLGSYPTWPCRIYELTSKIHFKFLLMFAKQMDDSWCGVIPTYEALEQCLTVELSTLSECWKIICKPSEERIRAMGTAHDAVVDAKMTLEIFWVTWKYRVENSHFFDVHCRLRMAPKKIYNQLARHVSISEKVVLKEKGNDAKFEKMLFMKRNYCAWNCEHIFGPQVLKSMMWKDMEELEFSEKLFEEFSDSSVAQTQANYPSDYELISDITEGEFPRNSEEVDERLEEGQVLDTDAGPSDRFQYATVPPVLSPMKPTEQWSTSAQGAIPKKRWIPSELAVGSKGLQEEYASGTAYKQRSSADDEADYKKAEKRFVAADLLAADKMAVVNALANPLTDEMRRIQNGPDCSLDPDGSYVCPDLMLQREEKEIKEREQKRREQLSVDAWKAKNQKTKLVTAASIRIAEQARDEITEQDANLDLTGGSGAPSKARRLVGIVQVPSPFAKKNIDYTKSYASDLSERHQMPDTGQIPLFDGSLEPPKEEDWLIQAARKRQRQNESDVTEEAAKYLRTDDHTLVLMTKEQEDALRDGTEEAFSLFTDEKEEDVLRRESMSRNQLLTAMSYGDDSDVPRRLITTGNAVPSRGQFVRGSRGHQEFRARYRGIATRRDLHHH
jgi:hypothetical protein